MWKDTHDLGASIKPEKIKVPQLLLLPKEMRTSMSSVALTTLELLGTSAMERVIL